jgi:hypothetical protein
MLPLSRRGAESVSTILSLRLVRLAERPDDQQTETDDHGNASCDADGSGHDVAAQALQQPALKLLRKEVAA